MNETTTFLGTTGTVGLGCSNPSSTLIVSSGTTTLGYSGTINGGTGIFTSPGVSICDSLSNSLFSTITINQNSMVKQVKAAVFTVTRNEDNKVVSAKLLKEVWVEVKNGSSLELAVAKQLDKDFDPSTTVVREIYSVTF